MKKNMRKEIRESIKASLTASSQVKVDAIKKLKFFNESFDDNVTSKEREKQTCQYCRKLFHIGLRMPVLFNCNHCICFECSLNKICMYDPQSKVIKNDFIHTLYESPLCSICKGQYEINYNNLPFHNICNCIICAKCSITTRSCIKCSNNCSLLQSFHQKVHKRSLKLYKYLDLKESCENCKTNKAQYCNKNTFIVSCYDCNMDFSNSINLNCKLDLDAYLYSVYYHYCNQ